MLVRKKVQFTYRGKLRTVEVSEFTDSHLGGLVEAEGPFICADTTQRPYKRFLRTKIEKTAGFDGDRPTIKVLAEE